VEGFFSLRVVLFEEHRGSGFIVQDFDVVLASCVVDRVDLFWHRKHLLRGYFEVLLNLQNLVLEDKDLILSEKSDMYLIFYHLWDHLSPKY
jgi:hypothetical protein